MEIGQLMRPSTKVTAEKGRRQRLAGNPPREIRRKNRIPKNPIPKRLPPLKAREEPTGSIRYRRSGDLGLFRAILNSSLL